MSQFRLETELDMAGYLDINFGHGFLLFIQIQVLLQQLILF